MPSSPIVAYSYDPDVGNFHYGSTTFLSQDISIPILFYPKTFLSLTFLSQNGNLVTFLSQNIFNDYYVKNAEKFNFYVYKPYLCYFILSKYGGRVFAKEMSP